VSQVVWGILGHRDLQLWMVGMAKLAHKDLSVHLDPQARKEILGPRAFLGWMALLVVTALMGHKDPRELLVLLGRLVKKGLLELQACQGCLDLKVKGASRDHLVLHWISAT